VLAVASSGLDAGGVAVVIGVAPAGAGPPRSEIDVFSAAISVAISRRWVSELVWTRMAPPSAIKPTSAARSEITRSITPTLRAAGKRDRLQAPMSAHAT